MYPYLYFYTNPKFLLGCYSTRLVVPTYAGPVVQIKNDNEEIYDLYTDSTQSFLSSEPNNTGKSIDTIRGENFTSVELIMWYDQSGNGNHAINNNTSVSLSNMTYSTTIKHVVDFQTSSYLKTISPIKPYSIFTKFWSKSSSQMSIITSSTVSGDGIYTYAKNIDTDKNKWFYNGSGTKESMVNSSFSTTTFSSATWNTIGLSVEDPYYTSNDDGFDIIGNDATFSTSTSVYGKIAELILFNTPMTQDEMQIYYDTQFNTDV
jgi:hypothetical protein